MERKTSAEAIVLSVPCKCGQIMKHAGRAPASEKCCFLVVLQRLLTDAGYACDELFQVHLHNIHMPLEPFAPVGGVALCAENIVAKYSAH